jgi:hypothetical protein
MAIFGTSGMIVVLAVTLASRDFVTGFGVPGGFTTGGFVEGDGSGAGVVVGDVLGLGVAWAPPGFAIAAVASAAEEMASARPVAAVSRAALVMSCVRIGNASFRYGNLTRSWPQR